MIPLTRMVVWLQGLYSRAEWHLSHWELFHFIRYVTCKAAHKKWAHFRYNLLKKLKSMKGGVFVRNWVCLVLCLLIWLNIHGCLCVKDGEEQVSDSSWMFVDSFNVILLYFLGFAPRNLSILMMFLISYWCSSSEYNYYLLASIGWNCGKGQFLKLSVNRWLFQN